MVKDESLTIRINSALKKALAKAAKADRRTVSAYVEMVLVRHLEEEGYLRPGAAE